MTTVAEAIKVLERVKKEFAAARKEWQAREADLMSQLRIEREKHEPKASQEPSDPQPTPAEVKALTVSRALALLDEMLKVHEAGCETWAKMTKAERTQSDHGIRVWAHPFTGELLGEVREKLSQI